MQEENKEETKQSVEEIPLQFIRKPEFRFHFCNSIQIAPGSKAEMQLFFGQTIAPPIGPKPEKVVCEQLFGIAITLEHARTFLKVLAGQLEAIDKIRSEQQPKDSE